MFFLILFQFSCIKNPVNDMLIESDRILFIQNYSGSNKICSIRPDGSDLKVIVNNDSKNVSSIQFIQWAHWSPDKSKIVIQGGPGSTLEYQPLYLMNPEGNLLKKLVSNGYMPIWATDGQNIIYARRRGYFSLTYDIFHLN